MGHYRTAVLGWTAETASMYVGHDALSRGREGTHLLPASNVRARVTSLRVWVASALWPQVLLTNWCRLPSPTLVWAVILGTMLTVGWTAPSVANCLSAMSVYNITAGQEIWGKVSLVWKGATYSNGCGCQSGMVGVGSEHKDEMCTVGTSCVCATVNGQAIMGSVATWPDIAIHDYGSSPKPFGRTDHFMWEEYEFSLLEQTLGCQTKSGGHDDQKHDCEIAPGVHVRFFGWDDQTPSSVSVIWVGDLTADLQTKLGRLYAPLALDAFTGAISMSIGTTGSKMRDFDIGWLRATHLFYKQDATSVVEHTFSFSRR
ncbi:hypothetical protein C3Y89_11440 [Rhizobium sp. UPM1132]|nr:hypothetical protein [Rhizobium ruizarguesonis]NKQ78655.1 hypothetical protein [Rhizobium ruizarguesonis]